MKKYTVMAVAVLGLSLANTSFADLVSPATVSPFGYGYGAGQKAGQKLGCAAGQKAGQKLGYAGQKAGQKGIGFSGIGY